MQFLRPDGACFAQKVMARKNHGSATPVSAHVTRVTSPAVGAPVPEANGELVYSSDLQPGIRRRRRGTGFVYVAPDGGIVKDEETLARIRRLAIPPAYRDVWICVRANGHLQATGYDARGRKQYRYHPRWRTVRDEDKFRRMLQFGKVLPKLHRRIAADLRLKGMPRERVLATVVRLLETTLIRIGNEEYARANRSYGLTTLRNRHVAVDGDTIAFEFRGKHGIRHHIAVADPRAARVVRRCLELPEQDLFEYVDAQGVRRDITSSDVNAYLKDITGEVYTAKDFRTWYATMSALAELNGCDFRTAREAKAHVKAMLEAVSGRLGNTPAMCRKCYVHPAVIDAFLAGELRRGSNLRVDQREQLLQLLRRLTDPSRSPGLDWSAPKGGPRNAHAHRSRRAPRRTRHSGGEARRT